MLRKDAECYLTTTRAADQTGPLFAARDWQRYSALSLAVWTGDAGRAVWLWARSRHRVACWGAVGAAVATWAKCGAAVRLVPPGRRSGAASGTPIAPETSRQ